MLKQYIEICTITLIGGNFAGYDGVDAAPAGARFEGYRALGPGEREPHEGLARALAAARAVFEATGDFPGARFMAALVRVDGGRAIVCQARGRRGW